MIVSDSLLDAAKKALAWLEQGCGIGSVASLPVENVPDTCRLLRAEIEKSSGARPTMGGTSASHSVTLRVDQSGPS